jgi:hypothetical protein
MITPWTLTITASARKPIRSGERPQNTSDYSQLCCFGTTKSQKEDALCATAAQ